MIVFKVIRNLLIAATVSVVVIIIAMVTLSGPYTKPELNEPESLPPPPLEELLPSGLRVDRVLLHLLDGTEVLEMSMERYLIGVTAAEMPAGFPIEALKAQVVAARTMVLYNTLVSTKPRHPEVSVCTDFNCCMAYSSDEQLRDKWGESYTENILRIINAVVDTDGLYMTYGSEPILAVFHSSSAGKTESSGDVWLTALPYLVCVGSPESGIDVPDYVSTVTKSFSEFIETITDAYPNAVFDDDAASWISEITYTPSGRISELVIGGVTVKGTVLRSMFNLRSTAIVIEFHNGETIFTVTGYGHGVGMSQYGAASMARDGKTYRDILSAYYSRISFSLFSV